MYFSYSARADSEGGVGCHGGQALSKIISMGRGWEDIF